MNSNNLGNNDHIGFPRELQRFTKVIRIKKGSKVPVNSTKGPFYKFTDPTIQNWISENGNIGFVLEGSSDLVVIDSDSDELTSYIDLKFPPTLTIETGSGGYHYYFRIEGWKTNHSFTKSGSEVGSIRANNWQVLVPPSIHPNGNPYTVFRKNLIKEISLNQMENLVDEFSNSKPVKGQHSGGGGGRPVLAKSDTSGYPNREIPYSQIKNILKKKGTYWILNSSVAEDWSGREFLLAKSLAEEGISKETIGDVLDRLSHKSKWHNRGYDYKERTILKAIESALEDPYVDFNSTMNYETKNRKVVYSGNKKDLKEGDRAIQLEVIHMTGEDDDGENVDVEFVSMSKGQFVENDGFGIQPIFNGNSKSLGSADKDDLELIEEGISEILKDL
jgi:hypothetical protein